MDDRISSGDPAEFKGMCKISGAGKGKRWMKKNDKAYDDLTAVWIPCCIAGKAAVLPHTICRDLPIVNR